MAIPCKAVVEYAAAPIEQKPPSLTHETSSVGARPSSAAPIEQKPRTSYAEKTALQLQPFEKSTVRESRNRTKLDGGGRGRPRSDRRAFAYSVKEHLFDEAW